ncbi:P-loop containing nucleoside triphosphate hydrolase protein [Rhizophagus diaphanus]|nr:P-loop containing nucleoside triphosphate hydrolase protein [Rhizophagus diaphanus] [Rhizophagus sp. MUCL 43196]
MSDARFQMLYAGHLMDRNTNSVDDPRVQHFKPDAWQVEVLDVIDKDESALLCCPTSSGKTFISYYAMEKVLKESDDGILIYVSPTKALVNQVTAEVYGRFEKSYDHGDKSTWGIYTREYRENHDKCQILITIPQMLETLILSPERASWARNIKRIIFDEIHMIGSEGGEFYDRLLLLSKSIPILALSATVGNPEPFNEWIAKSREARKQRMKLIITKKRFSDLQQYVYLPKFPLTKTATK